jgi:hypothetical protein
MAVFLIPGIVSSQSTAAPRCAAATSPVIVLQDAWLPRAGGGALPFSGGEEPWDALAKEMKERGRPMLDVKLAFDDRQLPRTPKAEYLVSSTALVRVEMPRQVAATDFERGAAVVREVVKVVRKWACDAPVRIVAEGVGGMHVRAHLQSAAYGRDVVQFITVGTTHGGGILEDVIRRLGAKGAKPCLAQLGLSEELTSASEPTVRAYFAAISGTHFLRDSLNRAIGRWKPLPAGLNGVDVVIDADSLKGRTADCSRAWNGGTRADNGVATSEAQRTPLVATADLRPWRERVLRGVSVASANSSAIVAKELKALLLQPTGPATSQFILADSTITLVNQRGQRSGADEDISLQTVVLRRKVGCMADTCAESDTSIIFAPKLPEEAIRLARLDSLRRISLGVYSATQRFSKRPVLQSLIVEHFRGPTIVVVDSSGRLGRVEPRAGVFPNGLRGIATDSLCLQGEGRAEGARGSIGSVRALSVLRLCGLVQVVAPAAVATESLVRSLPRFADWLDQPVESFPRCVANRSETESADADSLDHYVCADAPAKDSSHLRPHQLGFETKAGKSISLRGRTVYIVLESEQGVVERATLDFGLAYGEDQQSFVTVPPVDRRIWSDATSKPNRPEVWDPEVSSMKPLTRFAFYQVDLAVLNRLLADEAAKKNGRAATLPEEFTQVAIRIKNATGAFKVRVITR